VLVRYSMERNAKVAHLWNVTDKMSTLAPGWTGFYWGRLKEEMMRVDQPIARNVARQFCGRCDTVMLINVTCRLRVSAGKRTRQGQPIHKGRMDKVLVRVCLVCGHRTTLDNVSGKPTEAEEPPTALADSPLSKMTRPLPSTPTPLPTKKRHSQLIELLTKSKKKPKQEPPNMLNDLSKFFL
jgi:RNase P subunit RPR2